MAQPLDREQMRLESWEKERAMLLHLLGPGRYPDLSADAVEARIAELDDRLAAAPPSLELGV